MYPDAKIIYGSLSENPVSILNATSPQEDVIAVVGPEGGFTAEEEKLLRDKNAVGIKLTETVLRTETAATALATILATSRDNQ